MGSSRTFSCKKQQLLTAIALALRGTNHDPPQASGTASPLDGLRADLIKRGAGKLDLNTDVPELGLVLRDQGALDFC
jgi:hypothetical protein